MRKSKKTMANNPPSKAINGPNAYSTLKFKRGPKPKPRNFPVDPDRDKKIAEFLARKKDNQ